MAITNIPGWQEGLSDKIAKSPLQAYKRVPLVYKCANLVANALATTPSYLYLDDELVDWLFPSSLSFLISRVARDLQLYGKSYILKLTNERRDVLDLMRLNPNFMEHEVVGKGDNGKPIFEFKQTFSYGDTQEVKVYSHEEMLYIHLPIENNDVFPDVFPAVVALQSGTVLDYIATFGEYYFHSGAMPTTALSIPSTTAKDEQKRFETWLKRTTSGIKNAFGIITLRGEIKAVQLNPPAKDLAIPELDSLNRKRVMEAFGIPEGMVDKSANFASAEVHNRQFWDMTVKPLALIIFAELNTQLFSDTGYILKAEFQELSVYQVDEERRSIALKNLVDAGVTLESAWFTLGFSDLPEEMILERPPMLPEPTSPPTPLDDEKSITVIESTASKPNLLTHLERWRTKSLNRFRRNQSMIFSFDSDFIHPTLHSAISGALSEADSSESIRTIFQNAIDLNLRVGA